MTTHLNGLASLLGNIHLADSGTGLKFLHEYFGVTSTSHLEILAAMETEVATMINQRIRSQGIEPIDTTAGFNVVFKQIFGSNPHFSTNDEHRATYSSFLKTLRATATCDYRKLRHVCDQSKSPAARLAEMDSALSANGLLDSSDYHVNFNVVSFYVAAMAAHGFFGMPVCTA